MKMECHTLYINCFQKYRGPKFCPSCHQCAKIYPTFAEMMQFGRLGGPRHDAVGAGNGKMPTPQMTNFAISLGWLRKTSRLCHQGPNASSRHGLHGGKWQDSQSARGWVEHRSRVSSFPSSIRAIWSLAGIWDYLREGKYSEARARTAAQGPRAVGARLPGCGGSLWPRLARPAEPRTEWPS